jgi:hypothetical protein
METEYQQSAISFAEYNDPITEDIAAVLLERPGGRKAIVAYIREGYDANAKQKTYRAFDTEGKEIIAANYSLSHLKKELVRKEDFFHEQESIKEQALTHDMAEEERTRFKELTTLRLQKSRAHSRTR